MLVALGVDAVAVRDKFDAGIQDIDLFESIKGNSLVFVSVDRSQLTRSAELEALRGSKVTVLYLGKFWNKRNMDLWRQAAWITKHWRTVEQYSESASKGTVAIIQQCGRASAVSSR